MTAISQDLRYAIRRMKDAPGFTVTAIVTLALGLGVNSAVLSVAHAIFLKPLPLPEASRLVLVDGPFRILTTSTIAITPVRSWGWPRTTRRRRCTSACPRVDSA